VALIAGLGKAAELALAEAEERERCCRVFRQRLLAGLAPLGVAVHGDQERCVAQIVNLSVPGMDAESVIEAWADYVAISNGAACTSQAYTCSHVLAAMKMSEEQKAGAVRLSWWHGSELPDFKAMVDAIRQ
jgi:cysteine desulfurase